MAVEVRGRDHAISLSLRSPLPSENKKKEEKN